MKCPFCNHYFTIVIDTRPADNGTKIRRKRKCVLCENKFITYEEKEVQNETNKNRNSK